MSYILDALERSEQERNEAELPSFRQDKSMLFVRKQRQSKWPFWLAIITFNVVALVAIFYVNQTPSTESFENQQNLQAEATEEIKTLPANQEDKLSNSVSEQAKKAAMPTDGNTDELGVADLNAIKSATNSASELQSQTRAPEPEKPVIAAKDLSSPVKSEDSVQSSNSSPVTAVQTVVQNEMKEPVLIEPSLVEGTLIRPKASREAVSIQAAYQEDQIENSSPAFVTSSGIDASKGGTVTVSSVPLTQEGSFAEPVVEFDEAEQFSSLPYLHELAVNQRPKVPKLVFNSHIYSSDPSARRVMINNIYLREGQRFSEMDLVYIGEEFIVLDKRGESFKLPVMRDWIN